MDMCRTCSAPTSSGFGEVADGVSYSDGAISLITCMTGQARRGLHNGDRMGLGTKRLSVGRGRNSGPESRLGGTDAGCTCTGMRWSSSTVAASELCY